MSIAIRLIVQALIMIGMIVVSPAAVLLSDDFDSYANQAAFESNWGAIGTVAPISASLATEHAVSGTQSIRVDGTATTGQQRNQRLFTDSGIVTTTTLIVFSFDFYDSNAAAAPYRQFSEMRDGAGTANGQLVAMGLNNNHSVSDSGGNFYMARILGYTPTTLEDPDGGPIEGGTLGAGAFFKLNDFGNLLRSTGWHNLMVEIGTDDGLSADFSFYVDGILAERVSDAATLRGYDSVRLGSGVSNANNAAWYDNFVVATMPVPEPSTVGLGLLGTLALACRRRRGS